MTGYSYKKKPNHDEDHVIMRDGDASSSVTSESEHNECRKQHKTYRQRLDDAFHSNRFHILIVVLVIVCSLIVIVELLIDLNILQFNEKDRLPSDVLFYITVAIFGLFVMEMVVKIIVMRLRFFKHKMEIFDTLVVLAAFIAMLVLSEKKNKNSTDGLGLLVMLRLWRVTKILNSIVSTVRQESERKLTKERRARRAMEREIIKLRDYCLQQEFELNALRMLLKQNGVSEPTALRIPVLPRRIHVVAEVNETITAGDQPPPSYDEQQSQQKQELFDFKTKSTSRTSPPSGATLFHRNSAATDFDDQRKLASQKCNIKRVSIGPTPSKVNCSGCGNSSSSSGSLGPVESVDSSATSETSFKL